MIPLLALLSVLAAAAVQSVLPTQWWLGGLRLELMPALVAYLALTAHRQPWLTGIAVLAGLAQDAVSLAPFGLTALPYATVALLLRSLHVWLDRDLPWIQMLAGAAVSAVASLVALVPAGFHFASLGKLLVLALLSALVTPCVFLVLDALAPGLRQPS